ncbi:transcription factor Adf-1-like protein [Labeo rohita]|uniref:Transcription factor Adf-1-like protein n=1 Tax=Labeo rohita TaxID=84645 RepID=A0A498MSH0_LABRO|nr:transcription factor Adf-1-like protein [Labeo rohita]
MAETEKFIQAVCAYPLLYNVSLHDYRSSERRVKAWREVAASIGLSVVECKLRKEEGGRRLRYWPHRETLSFLDAHIRKRKRHSEALEELDSPEEQTDMRTPSSAASNLNGKTEEKEAPKSCEKAERAFDEDELFLLSYVPALKRLTPQKRAAVKMQIQQIMFDAEFKDQ